MKKALTIYVEDDAELGNLCGAFVCWRGGDSSVTMLNEKIPDGAEGFYLPWESETKETEWVMKEGTDERSERETR